MKRLACVLLALCAVLALAACGRSPKVDTDSWLYLRFEGAGVSLLLPGDMTRERTDDGRLFRADGDGLKLEVSACDELFSDASELEAWAGKRAGLETEAVPVNGAALIRVCAPEESRTAEYYAFGPEGDAYRVLLASEGDEKDRDAAAVFAAAAASLCGNGNLPADAAVLRIRGRTTQPVPDPLVLVNGRRELPEGWEEALDPALMFNSRGETVEAERGVCKAFLALRAALTAEGVRVEAAPCAKDGDCPERRSGLALDLYLDGGESDELWERVYARLAEHGFILRYPADGAYYTGRPFDPRHIRYVGADAAREISARGITLEEYLGEEPAVDFLVLVNPKNALPEDWEDELELVHMTNRHGEDIAVERTAYDAYCRLRDLLAEDGVHLDVNSAYRSVAEQQALAESYTRKYGADYVKAYVAVPGYSEHHTGLALDLYLESPDVWAKIHARLAECGFILRYPEGKEAITGYGYEPWHVRYVGVERAQEIASRGLTLEEYLDAA